jgi:hypothetical protein
VKLILGFFILTTAAAQTITSPDDATRLLNAAKDEPLRCQVAPMQPVLDFSFRFQAGYTVQVPLDQYRAGEHAWGIVTRIIPEGQDEPVYFIQRLKLSTAAKMDVAGEAGGGFVLGAGRYRADLTLVDDQARVCRAAWTIDAKPASNREAVRILIKPGTVREISLLGVQPSDPQPRTNLGRLTIFLHAVPVSPQFARIRGEDSVVLMGSLASLLESVSAKSVRLVVFNLDQQKEIYRKDNFTLQELTAVQDAIFDLQLATVDVHQLSPTGPQEFLQRLVGSELTAKDRTDEIVFLGPHSRLTDKPAMNARNYPSPLPKFLYLQYVPPKRLSSRTRSQDEFAKLGHNTAVDRAYNSRTGNDQSGTGAYVIPDPKELDALSTPAFQAPRDSIDYLVGDLKGKTVIVSTPTEFAGAVRGRLKN